MSNKFNPGEYQGKARVYLAIPGAAGIHRVWSWDNDSRQYEPGAYEARRYSIGKDEKKSRDKKSFGSLKEARDWQSRVTPAPPILQSTTLIDIGPLFRDVVAEWKSRRYSALSEGTKLQYDRMLNKHFGPLLNLGIHEINPKRIDRWIDELKLPRDQPPRRRAFNHELALLGIILRYYNEYNDDTSFIFPIKGRHRKAVETGVTDIPRAKDLTEEEFVRFRECLKSGSYGALMADLATVQYYQALRISEAAALHWADVQLDDKIPSNSRMSVVRSVFWPRKKGIKSYVKAGFKNSKSNGGIKEQPLILDAYRVLLSRYKAGASGLVFQVEGTHLEYRTIQHAYDTAFKLAGLSYSGSHILRHGGCRRLFNKNGDLAVAQQLLGNSDMKSALVYAKRHKGALTAVVLKEWDEREMSERGRKRSQGPAA